MLIAFNTKSVKLNKQVNLYASAKYFNGGATSELTRGCMLPGRILRKRKISHEMVKGI
jgi:hypothetical protein